MQPPVLRLNISAPWAILRPTMFRLMEKQYVDDFFEHGKLRLSSFEKFSQHNDEQRQDPSEGKSVNSAFDGSMTVVTGTGVGGSSYILCGASNLSGEVSTAFPDCDAAIQINNPTEFAAAISFALPNFRDGMEGACIYREKRLIERKYTDGRQNRIFEQNKLEGGGVDMKVLQEMQAETGGIEQFFLKADKYSPQSEYRLVWNCTKSDDVVDLVVPAAKQFCTRLNLIDGEWTEI